MDGAWQSFLEGPEASEHAAQIYRDVDELAESVAAYFVAGFELGEPGVAIATSANWDAIASRLAERGWPGDRIEATGLLVRIDAEKALRSFMVDGEPSRELFEVVVGGLVDAVAEHFPGRRIRAFGEMVNILAEEGRPDAAIALEGLWNELARTRDFSLLCGYRLDVFDRGAQTSPLPDICRVHSHVRPADDYNRLHRAVDAALEETLGPLAGKVYALMGNEMRDSHAPMAQVALMWVSENMPALADRILAAARIRYLEDAPAA